jgi:hypothetical protein
MGPTEKAMTASALGGELARYHWKAWAEDYVADRGKLVEQLRTIGINESILPDTHEAFQAASMNILNAVWKQLEEERARLSGDCYALPMFVANYMVFRAIAHSALQIDIEMETTLLRGALEDLGIDATDEGVMALLHNEIKWIETLGDNDNVQVRSRDIVHAWARILMHVMSLWAEAERRRADQLPSIGLDYVPRYSCFISYSHQDEEFCRALYERLRFHRVQVWYAPEAMKPGRKLHEEINAALRTHERLLLVLSEASLASNWVEHELYRARKREEANRVRMLFPIRLVSMERLKQWEAFDADSGRDLAREVREYFVPDFSSWKDEAKFEAAIRDLLDGLRREDPDASNQR